MARAGTTYLQYERPQPTRASLIGAGLGAGISRGIGSQVEFGMKMKLLEKRMEAELEKAKDVYKYKKKIDQMFPEAPKSTREAFARQVFEGITLIDEGKVEEGYKVLNSAMKIAGFAEKFEELIAKGKGVGDIVGEVEGLRTEVEGVEGTAGEAIAAHEAAMVGAREAAERKAAKPFIKAEEEREERRDVRREIRQYGFDMALERLKQMGRLDLEKMKAEIKRQGTERDRTDKFHELMIEEVMRTVADIRDKDLTEDAALAEWRKVAARINSFAPKGMKIQIKRGEKARWWDVTGWFPPTADWKTVPKFVFRKTGEEVGLGTVFGEGTPKPTVSKRIKYDAQGNRL